MLCAIRHPETFKLQSLLVDTDRMCGSLRLRLRRVARGRLSRKSWTDDERNTQNGPGFEADEQVSPGASFAGQELAQGLCAQNLSPDCLQLAGEVQGAPVPPVDGLDALGAPVLAIYAELDRTLTRSVLPVITRLEDLQKPFGFHIYEGTNHAFHNDTGANYHRLAACDAWGKTVAFFQKHLP